MKFEINDEKVKYYIDEIHNQGGTCYLVGGFVRDKIIGNNDNFDIDIEVHDIEYDVLLNIFKDNGKVQGNFGIIKLMDTNCEFAMPRNENKIGQKHNDFEINMDPYMDLKSAAKRRDFTMNTIMYNLKKEEVIDNYNGIEAIKNKMIIHTSNKFCEDPLRILRAIRFSFKLGFDIDEKTQNLCLEMLRELDNISVERKNNEIKKMIYCDNYDIGLEYLYKFLFKYYNIDKLHEIKQSPIYHPEGDVWIHTKQALLLLSSKRKELSKEEHYLLFLSLLFHDIGKINATSEDIEGKIRAHGHEAYSYYMSQKIIDDLEINKRYKKIILNLIKDHMKPLYVNKMRSKTIIELFEFYKDSIELLFYVFLFDKAARSINNDIEEMKDKFEKLKREIFDPTMKMYEYYKNLKKLYNGKYFMDMGITGENIKIKQQEKLIKEISTYRKNRDE